jgi:endogenous inhibitor of DNA gyrase (YacG/DUF329 family)
MALIFCPDCGKEVSDSAITCPHCAYPLNRIKSNAMYPLVQNNQLVVAGYIVVFLSLLILPIIFMISGIVIGVINITKGSSGHGILQIILALIFGIIGTFMGILSLIF